MRVALPKGHLQAGVLSLLNKAGLSFSFASDRDYRPQCGQAHVTAKLFKVRAIPQLVHLGQYEVGFCGLDLIQEADYELVEPLLDLRLNPVQIVVAVPRGKEDILSNPPRRPLLIATEYSRLADRWALAKNLAHITIQTFGSTEAYAPEDADIVFDNCETGRTIAANGLVVVERLLQSTTHLVVNSFALQDPARAAEIQALKQRLEEAVGVANG